MYDWILGSAWKAVDSISILMKRFKSIMRETWWVWLILVGGGTIAGILVSAIFFSAIPISVFAFFYFALVRYDEDGEPKVDR